MNPDGAQAEDQALRFLLGQGLKLKQRNYTCRLGEIDLILLDGADCCIRRGAHAQQSFVRRSSGEHHRAQARAACFAAARHYLSGSSRLQRAASMPC